MQDGGHQHRRSRSQNRKQRRGAVSHPNEHKPPGETAARPCTTSTAGTPLARRVDYR